VVVLLAPRTTQAHFLWVNTSEAGGVKHAFLYFSESATQRDYRLPERVSKSVFWQRVPGGETQKLLQAKLVEAEGEIGLQAPLDAADTLVLGASCRYGIYHGSLLTYFAKHVGKLTPGADALGRCEDFALDVVPRAMGDKLQLTVLWEGKPLHGAEVVVEHDHGDVVEAITDEAGRVEVAPTAGGQIGIRVGHDVKDAAGEFEGQPYKSAAYYATLTLNWTASEASGIEDAALPPLPEPIASFGAAVHDGWLYVYGGHTGEPHAHSRENVSPHIRRLNLRGGHAWEDLPHQTPLQSPALVAHGDFLYRIGGMTARNAAGEKDDLHSVAEFARFDPEKKEWTAMPSLPQPRSSHDAVVIGDKLYVVGGWVLAGPGHGEWCPSALVYDLSAEDGQWQQLPEPDFRRRALAAAQWQGKLVAIGGMTDESEISPRVDFFDPATEKWTQGPDLPSSDMHGFGIAACSVSGSLYASGATGIVYRLVDAGDAWEEVAKLETPRFFHRLVATPTGGILAVAGAAHGHGHVASIERVRIP
jgi:hypothetical protein